ncbi:MAG: putative CRISPR-associated protein [Candidatus Binataceae bacterium]
MNETAPETRRWLTEIANQGKLSGADAKRLEDHVAERKGRLWKGDVAERRKLSAELSGIGAVLDRWKPQRVQHLLVHTDTATGRAAAALVAFVLEDDQQNVQLLTAGGLRTDDFPSFREALAELTTRIEEWIPKYRAKNSVTLFNLTGGFKSVSAYLQALGMLYADRCVFLFEGAPAMEIPRLPVRLADVDDVRDHLKIFRRLANDYSVAEEETAGVPDSLLMVDDGQVHRSVWGDVVWKRVRKTLFAEAVLDPLSPKLIVQDAVRKTFKGMQADQRIEVNDALDALSEHLDSGRTALKSNTFKKLANPRAPSTHELYVSSDGPAWRLFGHFDDAGHFVADSLGTHL